MEFCHSGLANPLCPDQIMFLNKYSNHLDKMNAYSITKLIPSLQSQLAYYSKIFGATLELLVIFYSILMCSLITIMVLIVYFL